MAEEGASVAGRSGPGGRSRLQQVLDELVAGGAPWALAELRDESGIWSLTSGVAEIGTQRPVDAAGWFRIGSVTKTFTATVILQLMDEGKLGLADTVERWLPGVVPGGTDITVRQLLDHTSGLHNYTNDLTTDGILRDRLRRWTPREVVAQATKREPQFRPGTSRAYNNTAYVLAGMVIEQVTRRSYGEEIERRILRPLDLRRTLVCDDTELLPEPHAHGYLAADGKPVDITTYNPSKAGAAGGMVSTAADLNRFFAALLTGSLLRPAALQEMQTTTETGTPGVASGLGITRYSLPNGVTVWGKDGGFFGYQTWPFHTPDASRQLVVAMSIALNTRPTTLDFLARIASVFTPPEIATEQAAIHV
jgi:D-alanyl-D-alanine carboxypeptidase